MAMLANDRMMKNEDTEEGFCEYNMAKDYKGVFYGDNSEKKYFEGGAHFSYKDLYKRLNDLIKRLSPSRNGNETDRSDRSDSKRKNLNHDIYLENKFTKISDTLYKEKLQKLNPKLNNNFINSNNANRNVFNKPANNLSSKRLSEVNNKHSSNANSNNVNTIHFINNNNINLTHLNVNLNLNLNNPENHSRNKNLEMIDRITVLKRSVDKYTEEARKKVDNQNLRNTINNETKSNNSSAGKKLIVDKTKEVMYKKVNLNNFKSVGKADKRDSSNSQVLNYKKSSSREHLGSNLNNQSENNKHSRNISQPILENNEYVKKENNIQVKKIDNLLSKINNLFLSSYSNKIYRGSGEIFNTKRILKKKDINNMNNSSFKFNSLMGTKNESSLDKTNLYTYKDQLSNRQSMPSMDITNKVDKNPISSNNKINSPSNITINTNKSRNIKDNLLKNNILFNSNKTPKSYQHKFLISNYVPGAKSGSNIGGSSGINGTIASGSNGTLGGTISLGSKNILNVPNKLNSINSKSKEKLFMLNGNNSTSNAKLMTLKAQLNHAKEKFMKNHHKKNSYDSNSKI